MTRSDRRNFLTGATVGAAGLLTSPRAQAATDEKLVVGVIGAGGMGRGHLNSLKGIPNIEVKWIADVDQSHVNEGKKIIPDAKTTGDLREVLDDKSVDAVWITTPDHWHTPAALLAMDAGKHVYVEKPCCHNLREGRWLIEASKRTGKLVQHGTQSRSAPLIQTAIKLLRSGVIGTVLVARAWNVQYRGAIGHEKPSEPPQHFDYDSWVGPAPMVPFQRNRQHYSWHWWHAFGTGDAGNDGVHEIDIARWGLGVETHPTHIAAIGGKYVHDDDQEFPDTITAAFEYPGEGNVGQRRQLLFEMRLWSRYHPFSMDNGNEFLGTNGRMLLTKRGSLEVFGNKGEKIDVSLPDNKLVSITPHEINFLEAIRGRAVLAADATTAHLSSALPHLENLACRTGRSIQFSPEKESVLNDPEADRLLGRTYREGHWGVPKEAGK